MLKDILNKRVKKEKKKKGDDLMPFKLKGKLTIIGEKNGEVFHYDEGHNVVTVWAKHATMHLLTSETFSSHGNKTLADLTTYSYSSRSMKGEDHVLEVLNADGTCVSDEQYLGDNGNYGSASVHKYLNRPNNMNIDESAGDDNVNGGFIFPFFPTKMLFGTGVEYENWEAVGSAGRNSSEDDITSYSHAKNGKWTQTTFNNMIQEPTNYYSDIWNSDSKNLNKARTVNDVYSGILNGNIPSETDHGIPGAIKDATYRGSSEYGKLEEIDGKQFARESYRGIGRPAFVYAKRGRFFAGSSEARLSLGSTAGTENLESKITFSVLLPEQPDGKFYPHNGYTLKMAGLFCDARMLLGNKVPTGSYKQAATETDLTQMEYSNYMKMPCGIMWAKRKIAPIYKSHDVSVIAQWTIYLP